MPSGCEYDDPEAAYRRGFMQGAYMAVEAFGSGLVGVSGVTAMGEWVDVQLWKWRNIDQPSNRNLRPPRPPILELEAPSWSVR